MGQSSAPSEGLLYADLTSISDRLIREAATPLVHEAAAVNEQHINEKVKLTINLIKISIF